MAISKVGVLGCGLMGHGISQICAQQGWDVVVREIDQAPLDKGMAKIEKQLARAVEKGKMEQSEADAVRGRKIVKDDAYLATNTSSLSVATQADATKRPERMIGLHFFNPPQVMPLLEVVRAEGSADDAVDLGFEIGNALGKTTVAAGDNRGFIVNRLLVPYMLDAIRAHEQGVGSIQDIDTGMMAGASHPMGPLTLADFVGLDTLVAIADVMVDAYGEDRFAAPDTLRKMVDAGDFGRKSGKGFYDYSGDKPVPVDAGD